MLGRAVAFGLRNVASAYVRSGRAVPVVTRFALPTSSSFLQKQCYSQVHEFGPIDPPKQLTFKEVEQRVLKAIRAWDRFPQDRESQLTLDAKFVEDLGLDSLDKVEIVMSLEDEFGFEFPDADADKLKTPRDVFKYICEREDVYE
uniref:Acyl carrier protein n=1 Tax=Steinernema glaseri TaxID=37863 RepID=A0A1I7Z629_9BILA